MTMTIRGWKRGRPGALPARPILFAAFFLIGLFAASCAPFPREVMSRVDEGVTFAMVRENPDLYRGKTVLWGGVIVETEVRPHETAIVILDTALDRGRRPDNVDVSDGRFIALNRGYLDPAIYGPGREITLVGEVSGKEERPLGAIRYRYPIVTIDRLMLWEKRGAAIYYYYGSSWNRDIYPH
jgi:outer membrane lipoprotein